MPKDNTRYQELFNHDNQNNQDIKDKISMTERFQLLIHCKELANRFGLEAVMEVLDNNLATADELRDMEASAKIGF